MSRFITSQPDQQTLQHTLHSILQSKGNQAMKFGRVIEDKRNIFFKNHAENETGKLVPDLLLFFDKALYEVQASGMQLSFNIFR